MVTANGSPLGREILDLLQEHFVDPERLRAWTERGQALAMLGAAELNDEEHIDKLFSQLGVSHTRRFTPRQIEYYHFLETYASAGLRARLKSLFPGGVIRYPGIGVTVIADGRRFFASAVVPRGPADRAGLLPGDELVSVGEVPYAPVAPFKGSEGRALPLEFRREANGPTRSCRVKPASLRPAVMLANASVASAKAVRVRSKSIGYYRPWSLAGDRYWGLFVSSLLDRLWECDALVLDLRGSIGGASPDFAELFVGRSPQLLHFAGAKLEQVVNPRWRKPTVLLVDGTTRSGNEILAFALQRAGIHLVGTRTSGQVAAAMPFILGDGSLLLIAKHRVLVDGEALEGVGVQPDTEVPRSIAYSAGNDPQLDVALDLAAR